AASWVVAAVAIALAAWGWLRRPASTAAQPPSRLSIVVPSGTSFPGGSRLIDISADGSRIVYYSATPQGSIVELHDLDALESTPIKGTESGIDLHLSADGRTLYFSNGAQTKMSRVNLGGGAPMPIPGVPAASFLAGAPDGSMW